MQQLRLGAPCLFRPALVRPFVQRRSVESIAFNVGRKSVTPKFLAVDFDGTCTVNETIPILAHLAAYLGPADHAAERLAQFGELEKAYMEGLDELLCQHDLDGAPCQELDLNNLERCLEAMDDHSTKITERVSLSACLAGLHPEGVMDALAQWASDGGAAPAGMPRLRPGCAHVLSVAAETGIPLGVLSINWCPSVIYATLGRSVRHPFKLWCNDISEDGTIELHIPGASAKRDWITKLVGEVNGTGPVVYIGDSATDLLALLEADIGILIGESCSARRIARRFGVHLESLDSVCGVQWGQVDQFMPKDMLLEVTCWDDIQRFLLPMPVSGT